LEEGGGICSHIWDAQFYNYSLTFYLDTNFFKILTSHSLLYCRLPLLLSHLNIFFFFKIPNSKVRCISHCDFFLFFIKICILINVNNFWLAGCKCLDIYLRRVILKIIFLSHNGNVIVLTNLKIG
jgi:hypothetical protein